MRYILTIDEGTTSVRAVLYDVKNHKVKKLARAHNNLIEPHKLWCEQDANLIFSNTMECLTKVTKHINLKDVYALGITNQRETIVAWNKQTGEPLYNAIVWKCRRTVKDCEKIAKNRKIVNKIHNKTGLLVNSYFSATKIKWLIRNVPAVKKAIKQKNICFGTIETYLVYRLTCGKAFVTDVTNASRTMLFNIKTLNWDKELLKYFHIKKEWLATPVANDEVVGSTDLLGYPIKIAGLIGDQQSSLLGQLCITKGDCKNTYGTGCFMLANLGPNIRMSKHNLLTTVASKLKGAVNYALEGSIFSGGSIMDWLIEHKTAKSYRRLVKMAAKEHDVDIIMIPAFNGLGAPYWKMDGDMKYVYFTNDNISSKRAKAGFDAIIFRTYDIFKAMQLDMYGAITCLCVDGGQSRNKYLMARQSNILQVPVQVMNIESTCMGSIICSMLALNIIDSPAEMACFLKPKTIYNPIYNQQEAQAETAKWEEVMDNYLKGKYTNEK